MNTPTTLGAAIMACALALTAAQGAAPVVAVYSKTSNGYTRTALPDNSFKPEFYTFAPGGRMNGVMADKSIDSLSFYQVAGVVAQSLKTRNYLQTRDPNNANLLIFLYWGTTTGNDDLQYQNDLGTLADTFREGANIAQIGGGADPSGLNPNGNLRASAESAEDSALSLIAMANQDRDRNDYRNAALLGYMDALRDSEFLKPYSSTARDVISDVEENRYFVILKAYDFQRLWKRHQKILLWETHYSIRQFGNLFDHELPYMATYAAQFCGQNVSLIRRPLPVGHVEVGTPTVVEPPEQKR